MMSKLSLLAGANLISSSYALSQMEEADLAQLAADSDIYDPEFYDSLNVMYEHDPRFQQDEFNFLLE